MAKYEYRGWNIQTKSMPFWTAILYRPGSTLMEALEKNPEATFEEGEAVCLNRAKQTIDEIERFGK